MSSASADTSPMQPLTLPKNKSLRRAAWDQSNPSAPFLMKARGVAVVVASMPPAEICQLEALQVVMAPVKEMSMNARPARAGLKGL